MRRHILCAMIIMAAASAVSCRSQADRMAEFCIHMAEEVKASGDDCTEMARRLGALIDAQHTSLNDRHLCEASTACLPCKYAVRQMLKSCGYAESMKPVFERMTFSTTLRTKMTPEEDENDKLSLY